MQSDRSGHADEYVFLNTKRLPQNEGNAYSATASLLFLSNYRFNCISPDDRALRNSVILIYLVIFYKLLLSFFDFIKMKFGQHPLIKNIISHIRVALVHTKLAGYAFGITGISVQPDCDSPILQGRKLKIELLHSIIFQF